MTAIDWHQAGNDGAASVPPGRAAYDADAWDRQIESDINAGRLDALAAEALDDWHAGRCTDR